MQAISNKPITVNPSSLKSTTEPSNNPKQGKPFVPPLSEKPKFFRVEEGKDNLMAIFPKDIQSLAEYKQYEDKRIKTIGTAQLPYWFIESNKINTSKQKVNLLTKFQPYTNINELDTSNLRGDKTFSEWKKVTLC